MGMIVFTLLWTLPGISSHIPINTPGPILYAGSTLEQRIECDSWISRDKYLHFTACAGLIGVSHHIYAARLHGDAEQAGVFSVSLTGLIAVYKELYDEHQKGTFSWKDLFWETAYNKKGD